MNKGIRFGSIVQCMICFSLLTIIGTACQGPQKPTLKEEVTAALESYYRGVDFERKRDYENAQAEYAASIEISPRPRAYFRLGSVLMNLGRNDEALEALDNALQLSPGYTAAQQLKTQIQAQAGLTSGTLSDSDNTVPDADSATRMIVPSTQITTTEETPEAPSELELSIEEARKAGAAQDWLQVISLCEQILEQSPNHPESLYRLGFAQFQLRRYEDAANTFQSLTEIDPQNADAYNDLGVAYENLSRSADAAVAYQKAIDISQHADAYYNLANLKEKMGDYKTAISLYENYLKYDTTSAFADHARTRIKKLRRVEY